MAISVKSYINSFNVRSASILLIILIAGDIIFILFTFLNLFLHINDPMLNVKTERGYSEFYQYIKYFLISVLLIYISIKNSSIHYFSWVLVFVYLFIDDLFEIHERVGTLIANHLEFTAPLGLTLQEVGELSVTMAASVVLAVFVLISYKYGSKEFRKISRDIFMFLLLLFFFGVFLDMAHLTVDFRFSIKFILIVIEDGGEMLSASCILWYVYLLALRGTKADYYLCDFLGLFQNNSTEIISK